MNNVYCTELKFAQIPAMYEELFSFTNYWNFDMQYKIYYTISCYVCRFLSSKQSAIFTKQRKPNHKQRKLNKYCFGSGNASNEVVS